MTPPMALPPEIQLSEADLATVRIKAHLLRAKLEMSQEEADEPLPLVQLMTLLTELVSHVTEMEGVLTPVWSAWRQFARSTKLQAPAGESLALLREMRAAALEPAPQRLREALSRQRRAAQLCLVLQSALKVASTQFACELAKEFDPTAITAAVRAVQPQAKAEDFWRCYEEQADRTTHTELEQRLTRQLVAAIEGLFQMSGSSEF